MTNEKKILPPLPSCRDVAAGRITSQALTELCLERIEALNPALNAFVALDPTALEQARESDRRLKAGKPRSRIEGVPVAVKDNLLVRGIPATWGDRLFEDFVPDHDEVPIRLLREAGAVIVGKTNTPSIASAGITDNVLFGPTRNPWNPALTPGGSSGGSAAAVASGMVPLALGTDGGGSTRRPAAHTGIWGFRPSIGLIARGEGFPPLLGDLEVVGPMARTLEDLHALTAALAGARRQDAASRFVPPLPEQLSRPSGPLRIAVIEQIENEPVDADIRAAFRHVIGRMSDAGHDVVSGRLPAPIAVFNDIFSTVSRVGMAMVARHYPRFHELASAAMREQARQGETVEASAFMQTCEDIRRLRGEMAVWFADFDALLMPTTAAQPWPIGETHPPVIDGQAVGGRGHAVFTSWVNVIGHPSLNVPIGQDSRGMPVGLQVIGDFGCDGKVLEMGGVIAGLGR